MTERKTDSLWDDRGLDAFFDAARDDAPMPSGDFMARIEAQALDALPRPAPAAPGVLRQLLQALGGWPGAAGLAAACAAGLWFGFNPTLGVSDYLGLQAAEMDTLGVDPLSGYDLAMLEG